MTRLTRAVRREVETAVVKRPLIFSLEEGGIVTIREKGRRFKFRTTVGQIYVWAAKAEAERARLEKAKAKAARKKEGKK